MEFNVFVILILAFAFLGGLATATLGYLGQTDKFNIKKYLVSVLTAFIGAVGVAAVFNYTTESEGVLSLLMAFLAGAGIEVTGNRVIGVVTTKINSTRTASDVSGDLTKPIV